MHKLVLALATVAAFGLSTAAFAETPAASTSTPSTQSKTAQSQAPVAHKMRASHRAGAVVRHHVRHHRVTQTRHNGHGRKVAVKHMPAKKTVTTKSTS
jgi:hypothetical protein